MRGARHGEAGACQCDVGEYWGSVCAGGGGRGGAGGGAAAHGGGGRRGGCLEGGVGGWGCGGCFGGCGGDLEEGGWWRGWGGGLKMGWLVPGGCKRGVLEKHSKVSQGCICVRSF